MWAAGTSTVCGSLLPTNPHGPQQPECVSAGLACGHVLDNSGIPRLWTGENRPVLWRDVPVPRSRPALSNNEKRPGSWPGALWTDEKACGRAPRQLLMRLVSSVTWL